MADGPVREAVGVFDDEASLQSAADELLIAGFDRSHLSLLAAGKTVEEKLGHQYTRVEELEDDLAAPRIAYMGSDSRTEAKGVVVGGLFYVGAIGAVGAIVASGGTIAGALIGAVLAGGAGGLVGAVLASFIGSHHAHYLQEQLDHGGILLWVRTIDSEHEQRAIDILSRHSAEDVHLHGLPEEHFTTEAARRTTLAS